MANMGPAIDADAAVRQNSRGPYKGTVPKDELGPIGHPQADVPMLIPIMATVEPSKPKADTGQGAGPSGASISIPTVGKAGQ